MNTLIPRLRSLPDTDRRWRGAPLLAVIASLLVVSALVVTTSRAAFLATTDNTGNQLAAGTVTLVDDDSGSVMFNVSAMKPGDSVSKCIVVTYQGSLAANVKLYGSVAGTGLGAYLDMTVERGTDGSFSDCSAFVAEATPIYTGTLANFAATHTSWGDGLAGFSPTGGSSEAKTFKFTLTLQDDNLAQGKNATANFTWEAQNT